MNGLTAAPARQDTRVRKASRQVCALEGTQAQLLGGPGLRPPTSRESSRAAECDGDMAEPREPTEMSV